MKQLVLLVITCTLFACHSQNDPAATINLLKGDWAGPEPEEGSDRPQSYLSITDSTTQGLEWDNMKHYTVKDDTLFYGTRDSNTLKLAIVHFTADTLILANLIDGDTLQYTRIKPKNNSTPTAIFFGSSGCFGPCESMYVSIDSSRTIRFLGLSNTSLKRGHSGTLSQAKYDIVLNKLRNLPLDSLKERYEAPWTDDATYSISIVRSDSTIRSVAYGHYKEPIELRLLLMHIQHLYKHTRLQPDTSVNEQYFLLNPQFANPVVPPPPVTPIMREFTPPHIDD